MFFRVAFGIGETVVMVVVGATVVVVVVGAMVMMVVVGTTVISVVAVGTGVGVTVAGFWETHPINSILATINPAKIRKILFFSMTKILHILDVTGMF